MRSGVIICCWSCVGAWTRDTTTSKGIAVLRYTPFLWKELDAYPKYESWHSLSSSTMTARDSCSPGYKSLSPAPSACAASNNADGAVRRSTCSAWCVYPALVLIQNIFRGQHAWHIYLTSRPFTLAPAVRKIRWKTFKKKSMDDYDVHDDEDNEWWAHTSKITAKLMSLTKTKWLTKKRTVLCNNLSQLSTRKTAPLPLWKFNGHKSAKDCLSSPVIFNPGKPWLSASLFSQWVSSGVGG